MKMHYDVGGYDNREILCYRAYWVVQGIIPMVGWTCTEDIKQATYKNCIRIHKADRWMFSD